MYVAALMKQLQPLDDFRQYLDRFLEGENFVLLLGLIVEEAATIPAL